MALLNRKRLLIALQTVPVSGGLPASVKTFVDALAAELDAIASGSLGNLVLYEVPSGAITGSNTNFTTADNFSQISVYFNGQRLTLGVDFTVTGANAIQMTNAPQSGDVLTVQYIKT